MVPKTLGELIAKAMAKGKQGEDIWKAVYNSSQKSNAGIDARYQHGDAGIPFYLDGSDD
jgi:hypothetical protein